MMLNENWTLAVWHFKIDDLRTYVRILKPKFFSASLPLGLDHVEFFREFCEGTANSHFPKLN